MSVKLVDHAISNASTLLAVTSVVVTMDMSWITIFAMVSKQHNHMSTIPPYNSIIHSKCVVQQYTVYSIITLTVE